MTCDLIRIPLESVAVISEPSSDNVALAHKAIPQGSNLIVNNGPVTLRDEMKPGDRFALTHIGKGEYLVQYGYPFARSQGIRQGERVTAGNTLPEIPPLPDRIDPASPSLPTPGRFTGRTFMGYRRSNGRCGTRNYYIIVPTSMCASAVAQQVAERFTGEYSGTDGVLALPNTEGCGCAGGLQIERFLTVLRNFVFHENVGGALMIDLGCEQTNYPVVQRHLGIGGSDDAGKPLDWLTIQKEGGTKQTVEKAAAIVSARLAQLAATSREPCQLSELVIGSECGASDAFSGISANRVIGAAVDRVIACGGAAIFSEFPEMVGAEQVLFPRMRNREIIAKFIRAMAWYQGVAAALGMTMDDNLVPENRAGGLLNPYIKSLGAVMKGGSAVIEDVLDYGERPRCRGLHLMQGPGNDLESVTGLAAAGATVICFSTGRGTVTGSAIVPVLKISSTSDLFARLPDDIDFDAGGVLGSEDPAAAAAKLGDILMDAIIETASGRYTKPEQNHQHQFQIWTAGKLSL